MECGNHEAASAAELFLALAAMIPTWYYFLGSFLLFFGFLYNFLEFHLLGDIVRGFRGDKVLLTFNPASEVYQGVVSKCRILHGRYLATPWLSSPHFQIAFVSLFGNPPAFSYRREIFRASDGGTIALDWLLASDVSGCSSDTNNVIPKEGTSPIVVVVPGLTSDSSSSYVKHLVYKIAKRGWNVVVSNHRGLGGVPLTSDCIYTAGWTEDVREVIIHIHQEYPRALLFAVGMSLGANILVKYLGEDGEGTPISGAASICAPWDFLVCDRFFGRKLIQRLYDRALGTSLKGYVQLHRHILSRISNWEDVEKIRSLRDFHHYVSCPVMNYETVDAYYRRCSCVYFVGNIAVPLLCINAIDDPVCMKEAIPWDECRVNKNIVLATTAHGGHLGFFEGVTASRLWWVGAVDEFLGVLHSSSLVRGPKKMCVVSVRSSLESSVREALCVNGLEDGVATVMRNGVAKQNIDEDLNDDDMVVKRQSVDKMVVSGQPGEKTCITLRRRDSK